MLVTLADILTRASAAGYGEPELLRHRFLHLQRIGLVGPMAAKAAKRGGEGLWHPAQGNLFFSHLANLAAGRRRATLANAVVGSWLLQRPGVELRQAQRAMRFWVESVALAQRPSRALARMADERAAGRRSLRRRGGMALVDQLVPEGTGRPTRRRLRDAVEDCLDQLPAPSQWSLDNLRDALLAAAGDASTARAFYERLLLRFGAVAHLDLITSSRPDAAEVWRWMLSLVSVEQSDIPKFLNAGCGTAAEGWGGAIRAQVLPWNGDPARSPPRLNLGEAETLWGRHGRG